MIAVGQRICRNMRILLPALLVMLIFNVKFNGSASVNLWTRVSQVVPFISRNNDVLKDAQSSYLIPADNVLAALSESDLLKVYWKYINTIQVLCRNQTRVGSLKDGGKDVCLDGHYKPSKPCIVYSFGSNFQFDFDISMHNFYGCDVFTYDPSYIAISGLLVMEEDPIYGYAHQGSIKYLGRTIDFPMNIKGVKMPPEIKFELRGLSNRDWINEKKWKMSSLETILKDNKHENSVIDILKIDIQGSEWESVPSMINAGIHKRVKQLLIEVHVGRKGPKMDQGFWSGMDLVGQLRVLRLLYESGFRIFMREHNLYSLSPFVNPPNTEITPVNEIYLINIHFL